jgi:hypothetical protein
MAQAGEAVDGAGTPRIAKRYKVFEATRMQLPTGERRVHLINVSETGALVHGGVPVPVPSTVVRLDVAGDDVPARVVWADGDRFGVMFLSRLTPVCLARLIS